MRDVSQQDYLTLGGALADQPLAEADLGRTNALLEPDEAEDNGLRLVLPTASFVPTG